MGENAARAEDDKVAEVRNPALTRLESCSGSKDELSIVVEVGLARIAVRYESVTISQKVVNSQTLHAFHAG